MIFPWAVLIALVFLGLAYGLKEVVIDVLEDKDHFLLVMGGFLVLYVGAAFLVSAWIPKIEQQNDLDRFATETGLTNYEGGL